MFRAGVMLLLAEMLVVNHLQLRIRLRRVIGARRKCRQNHESAAKQRPQTRAQDGVVVSK